MSIKDDVITHRVLLEYQKNRIVNDSLKSFIEVVPELKDIILYIEKNKLTKLPIELELKIIKLIQRAYQLLQKQSEKEIAKIGSYENSYNNLLLASLLAVKFKKENITQKEVLKELTDNEVIDLKFPKSIKVQELDTSNLLVKVIKQGIKNGDSSKLITNNMLTKINVKQSQLNSLIRTTTANIINESNYKAFERNKDFIKKLKYSAVLDSRTTDICRSRNGKLYSIEESKSMIPAHWNCRSFFIPVIDDDFLLEDNYTVWQSAQKSDNILLKSDDNESFKISSKKEMSLEQLKKQDEKVFK